MKFGYKPNIKNNRFGRGKKYHSHDGYPSHLISSVHGEKRGIFPKGCIPWNKGTKGIMKRNSGSFTSERMSGVLHPMWRGGHNYWRGCGWKGIAKRVIEEDLECQDCGRKDRLQVHHLVPFRYWIDDKFANQRENLITLCPICHKKADWVFQIGGKECLEKEINGLLLEKELASVL